MTTADDIHAQIAVLTSSIAKIQSAAAPLDPASPIYVQLRQTANDLDGARTQLANIQGQVQMMTTAGVGASTPPTPQNGTTAKDSTGAIYVKANAVGLIALGAFALGAGGGYVLHNALNNKKKKARAASETAGELPAGEVDDEEEEEEEEETPAKRLKK